MARSKLIAILCLVIAACAPSGITNNRYLVPDYPERIGDEDIPILPVVDGLVVVPASIDGVTGFRMLVDTGAQATALFAGPRVSALDLETNGSVTVSGTGGGGAPASFSAPVDVAIGSALYRGMTPLVFDWQDLPFFPSKQAVFMDGVTGLDLYTRFILDVEPAAGRLRLHPPGADLTSLPSGAVTLPMTIRNGSLYVAAEVVLQPGAEPVTVDLHLDTGDTGALTLIEGRQPGFLPSEDAVTIASSGVGGMATAQVERGSRLRLGDIALSNVPLAFVPEPEPSMGADGRLGAAVLNRFRYVIDHGRQQLTLVPGEQSLRPFPEQASVEMGLAAIGDAFDRLAVLGTTPGGAADRAGFHAGDIIVSIDSRPASDIARIGVDAALADKRPGDEIVICREGDDPAPDACTTIELTAR